MKTKLTSLLAALAAALPAPAAVVMTDIPDTVMQAGGPPPRVSTLLIDLNEDGTDDFRLQQDGMEFYIRPLSGAEVLKHSGDLSPFLQNASLGTEFSFQTTSHFQWTTQLGTAAACNSFFVCNGWPEGDYYAGLRLEIDGHWHYGWVLIGRNFPIAKHTVYAWAWETEPDTPILAGAIPEPTAPALLLAGCIPFLSARSRAAAC